VTEQRFLGRQEITADVRRIQGLLGTVYAAGGIVKLGENGIEIVVADAQEDKRSYKFVQALGGDATAFFGSHITGGVDPYSLTWVWAKEVEDTSTMTSVVGAAPDGFTAAANLIAEQDEGANYASVNTHVDPDNTEYVTVDIGGALNVRVYSGEIYIVHRGDAESGIDARIQADMEVTYVASTRALKTNIEDYAADRDVFMQLRPRTFNSITNPEGRPIIGLIAEEVEETAPNLASYMAQTGPDGKPDMDDLRLATWDDKQLMITMVSMIQQQQQQMDALQAEVAALKDGR